MRDYALPTRSLVKNDQNMMVARPDVPRSRFLGSWTRNTTFDAGELVPFVVDEVLPGDHMKYDVTAYVRMATAIFPIFDNQRIDTFFFFVPNRLVWKNWQRFMGEQEDPDESIDLEVPVVVKDFGFQSHSLGDHFGLPINAQIASADRNIQVNALPFRAYQLIWNEWFRDQNLQDSIKFFEYDDAPKVINDVNDFYLLGRAKMHDYFTSCLPWPSKFPGANIPVNGKVPVSGLGFTPGNATSGPTPAVYQADGSLGPFGFYMAGGAYAAATGNQIDSLPDIYVDLARAGGVGLNALRNAWMVQQLVERDARGGTRYVELLRSHFGVDSPDARLQRPELIGGGSQALQITPIAQTVGSVDVPLGALGGVGTAVGQHRASYSSVEHGYIIGLINVQSELSYFQGIPRTFSRKTRYDYYWPSLAHLGEQAVYMREIYARGEPNDGLTIGPDGDVFGYQERWHEYRSRYSEVTGQFRRGADGGSLDAWHLAQSFLSPPLLDSQFIIDAPPMTRVLAAGSLSIHQQYLANILIKREAVRPLPVYSTPAQLGRM